MCSESSPAPERATPVPDAMPAAEDTAGWIAQLKVAERACCCSARPSVVAVLPPAPGRPGPVDLFLCGHHYRSSRRQLHRTGARVHRLPRA
ncbi:MAG TPA: hypothetical protein VMI33_05190 [Streptosporangiaceae bacterium]|nr:hypothetical protein [Streptosporangiaceae bacterium]